MPYLLDLNRRKFPGSCFWRCSFRNCWKNNKQIFIIGNGGSGGNANHIANDYLYPISKKRGVGLKVHSLCANASTLLCIANDEGYENIFSYQLEVLASAGDLLIALSGSGNSKNIINALTSAKKLEMKSFSILGFDGGKAKMMSDDCLHFETQNMQIAEDAQMICLHMICQNLELHQVS